MRNLCLWLGLLLLTLGCSEQSVEQASESNPTSNEPQKQMVPFLARLNSDERGLIDQLRKSGGLKVATRVRGDVYDPSPSGRGTSGFHYELLADFCQLVDLPVSFKVVEFSDYFKRDGVIPENVYTDEQVKYRPDLLREVNLYMDSLTELPWRRRLMHFIPVVRSRQLLVTRKGEEVKQVQELTGRTVVVAESSAYYMRFKKLEQDYGLEFNYDFTKLEPAVLSKVSSLEGAITAIDSSRIIREIHRYEGVSVCIPLSEPEVIAWAVAHDQLALGSALNKYLIYARETGVYSELWDEYFRMPLLEYLKLMK